MRRIFRTLLLAGLLGLGAGARGTWFVPLTPEELSVRAEWVVRARVEAVSAQRDAQGRIFTRIELAVAEVWKGTNAVGRCVVVAGGGVLGEEQVQADGAPEYGLGDEVVVFLVRNSDREWVTLGLSQGQFLVERETGTGRTFVHNRFWGSSISGPLLDAKAIAFPRTRPLALEELRRRIQEATR